MTTDSLRERLRDATSASHDRLHRHRGLSAAAKGKISVDDYRALLARLYGFHRPFEACIGGRASELALGGLVRSSLLACDLESLGVAREMRESLPRCATLPPVACEAEALGALYVVEGSTLGGAQIARALKTSLAPLGGAGCRFFSNDGAPPRNWTGLLARIEALSCEPDQERAIVKAAVLTFQLFEDWMADWELEAAPENRAGV
jgi:heme oxygenase (biliverdin-IX-beta and delta-forming)